MRCALILAMFAASLANAAWRDYREVRDLNLDAADVHMLDVEAGAGALKITGVAGAQRIVVTATIEIPDASDDEAQELIASGLSLSLVRDGDRAILKSRFERGWQLFDGSPRIQLDIRVPERMSLKVDDGSGSVEIGGVLGAIDLHDGSGSITLSDVGGPLSVDDGSGALQINGVRGDVSIEDGSGSIDVHNVAGSVTIDDGSGSITVSDVDGDLVIEDDGSGSLRFSDIEGAVENNG